MTSISLGRNIAALNAQRHLSRADELLGKSLSRLSSGMRINSAADDAAGLSIANALNTKSRVYNVGVRNVSDGISAISIVSGAIGQLSNISQRLSELATQAASGSYSDTQRQSLDQEGGALIAEYNRIIQTTEFNGRKLLDGRDNNVTVQAGFGSADTLKMEFGKELGVKIGDGTFVEVQNFALGGNYDSITTGDLNNDGITDVGATSYALGTTLIAYGNGDGSFRAAYSINSGSYSEVRFVDLTNDGRAEIVLNSTFNSTKVYRNDGENNFTLTLNGWSAGGIHAADFNQDGKSDLFLADILGGPSQLLFGNGDGSFSYASSVPHRYASGNAFWYRVEDVNADGYLDYLMDSSSGFEIKFGNGDGTFKAGVSLVGAGAGGAVLADINNDGRTDIVLGTHGGPSVIPYLGQADGSFTAGLSFYSGLSLGGYFEAVGTGDFNGDGEIDVVVNSFSINDGMRIFFGNGNGTFRASSSTAIPGLNFGGGAYKVTDYNGDGRDDVMSVTSDGFAILLSNGDGSFSTSYTANYSGSVRSTDPADFNGDGVIDHAIYSNGIDSLIILNGTVDPLNRKMTLDSDDFSVATQDSARTTLDNLATLNRRLALETGNIGSTESRLRAMHAVLSVRADEYTAASNRITNIDVAEESGQMIRATVLRQAGSAVLAQANLAPSLALKLLQ